MAGPPRSPDFPRETGPDRTPLGTIVAPLLRGVAWIPLGACCALEISDLLLQRAHGAAGLGQILEPPARESRALGTIVAPLLRDAAWIPLATIVAPLLQGAARKTGSGAKSWARVSQKASSQTNEKYAPRLGDSASAAGARARVRRRTTAIRRGMGPPFEQAARPTALPARAPTPPGHSDLSPPPGGFEVFAPFSIRPRSPRPSGFPGPGLYTDARTSVPGVKTGPLSSPHGAESPWRGSNRPAPGTTRRRLRRRRDSSERFQPCAPSNETSTAS